MFCIQEVHSNFWFTLPSGLNGVEKLKILHPNVLIEFKLVVTTVRVSWP